MLDCNNKLFVLLSDTYTENKDVFRGIIMTLFIYVLFFYMLVTLLISVATKFGTEYDVKYKMHHKINDIVSIFFVIKKTRRENRLNFSEHVLLKFLIPILIILIYLNKGTLFASFLGFTLGICLIFVVGIIYSRFVKKDLTNLIITIFLIFSYLLEMINRIPNFRKVIPPGRIFFWILLMVILVFILNFISLNYSLNLMNKYNSFFPLILCISVMFLSVALISFIFGMVYINYPHYFYFTDYQTNLITSKSSDTGFSVLLYPIYIGIQPLTGGFFEIYHPYSFIAYLPLFEKILGYTYVPIFIGTLLSGRYVYKKKKE